MSSGKSQKQEAGGKEVLQMRANTRLMLSLMMVVGSVLYGLLVAENPSVAEAVALGYVSLLLTVFFAVNLWKRP